MRRIVFRADGNAQIGLGHVYRSLAMAEMLEEDFELVFASVSPMDELKHTILGICDRCIELKRQSDEANVDGLLPFIQEDDIVVLDGYHFDGSYQQTIREHCYKVVSIDDMHQGHFYSDYVINHCGALDPDIYDTEPYTKLLLGEKYALLRPEFLEAARNKIKRDPERTDTLFVSMGGSDVHNLTAKILESVETMSIFSTVNVVIGAANDHYNMIKLFADRDKRIQIHRNLSGGAMCDLMKASDVAIAPGSGIALEVCAVGMGFLTGYYTDNQKDVVNWLDKTGCALNIGNMVARTSSEIQGFIKSLLNSIGISEMMQHQNVVDGYSDQRIRKLLVEL